LQESGTLVAGNAAVNSSSSSSVALHILINSSDLPLIFDTEKQNKTKNALADKEEVLKKLSWIVFVNEETFAYHSFLKGKSMIVKHCVRSNQQRETRTARNV
jgi:hypothetical protein